MVVNGWMYGCQLLAIMISYRRASKLVLPFIHLDFVHIITLCDARGLGCIHGGTCFVCDGMCVHRHNPIGLRANLGTLGEHMHLKHFSCVYSYVGIAWIDAWFMGALTSQLCCKCYYISYVLHYVRLLYPASGRVVTSNIVMSRVSYPRGLTFDFYSNWLSLTRHTH